MAGNSLFTFSKNFLAIFLLGLVACSNAKEETALENLSWLEGRWEYDNNEQTTIETWEKHPKHGYRVKGWLLEGTDTIFSENIEVKQVGKEIYYLVSIPGQHNDQPVKFKLTENNGKKAAFVNPQNDFPSQIEYSLTPESNVLVQLTGTMNGKPVSENYTLKKVPALVK